MYAKVRLTSERFSLKQNVISGIVTELGRPVSRKVRAYMRSTGVLLGSAISDKNGKYKMYLPQSYAYTIIALDPKKVFNAVIQDNVVPK